MDKAALREKLGNNRWLRRAVWLAGGVALLWGVGWLLVPPVLRHQAERIASEQLGRKVTIGAVDFKPWSLELTVSDVAVATADASAAQFSVKRFYADAELQSLLRLAPVVDALTVEAPTLRLTHLGDGHYDVDDVLAKLRRPAEEPPSAAPRFALYNLALTGGAIDFTDQAVQRTHAVRELQLTVPFLSNLDSQREVKVEPHLAFNLNGSRFGSAAEATPFAPSRKTDATLKLAGMDLAPYLGYLPASLPVKLQAAVLDADLRLTFEQQPRPLVKLSGTLAAHRVRLADAAGQELLGLEKLAVALADVRPLERMVQLDEVTVTAPQLFVRRDPAGRLNLLLAAAEAPAPAVAERAANAASAPQGPASPQGHQAPQPWQVAVGKAAIRDGRVAWTDETTAASARSVARVELQGLALDVSDIALPFSKPLAFSGAAVLSGPAPAPGPSAATAQQAGGTLKFSGDATDRQARVTAQIGALPLGLAAPYLAQYLEPALEGTLDAALGLNWEAAAQPGQAAQLQVTADSLVLDRLALRQGKSVLASVQRLEVGGARVDPGASTVALGKLAITAPQVRMERGADGRWMYAKWLKERPVGATTAQPAHPAGRDAQPVPAPWKVAVDEFTLTGGQLGWQDQGAPRPVAFEVSSLQARMTGFDLAGRKPVPLQLSARVGAGRAEPGRLSYRGTVGLNPVSAQGRIDATHIPAHAFEPYFGEALNIELLRADASFKGQASYLASPAGLRLRLAGDAAVEEFRANSVPGSPTASADAATRPAQAQATGAALAPSTPRAAGGAGGLRLGEELLNWKALNLRGLDVALTPGTATRVDVKETVLSDFFARIIIHETGRINLQDLVKSSAQTTTEAAPKAGEGRAAPLSPPAGKASATAQAAPVIHVGPVSLLNGKVLFSDRLIRPNYSANLTELTGKLSAFSSEAAPDGQPQLADLELRGRAEGTATLEVVGKLNPLAKPLALDIQGKVRDLELPPLSPYSVKYAGHGIERGKLSMDVKYQVQPDGQLTASNNLVLNQLSFGDPVEGAPQSLPVRLAVALLADRHGVIDINLPISGSLNDPQFRLGSIIFKVIGNLIAKAVTSPFSLLASAFGGGGDELGKVSFAPGSAALTAPARQALDKVAQALNDRPALKMTVIGEASLEAEREGYKRERLQTLVQAEKRRRLVADGGARAASGTNGASSDAAGETAIVVSAEEYPALLKAVYQRADMPKPRNLIGLAKDIPQGEMEALLLANIPVSEEQMRELALQRGVAVRDYLASQKLPVDRLFLGAAKSVASEAAWHPRAELSLTTR